MKAVGECRVANLLTVRLVLRRPIAARRRLPPRSLTHHQSTLTEFAQKLIWRSAGPALAAAEPPSPRAEYWSQSVPRTDLCAGGGEQQTWQEAADGRGEGLSWQKLPSPLPLKNNLVAIGALVRAFLTVVGEPEPHLARGLGSPRPISGRWSAASSIEEARPVVDTHDRQWVEPARCDRG